MSRAPLLDNARLAQVMRVPLASLAHPHCRAEVASLAERSADGCHIVTIETGAARLQLYASQAEMIELAQMLLCAATGSME